MSTEDKMFEIMTKIYGEMQTGFKEVDNRFQEVGKRLDNLENHVVKTNLTIENEISPKLSALFDGYKQNANKLDHIEDEVSKHEEIIWKRVK